MVMRRLTYHSRSITRGTKEKMKTSSSSFGKSAIALGIGAAAFGSFGIATFAAGRWESPPPPPPSSSNGNAPPRSGGNRRNRSSSSGDGSAFGTGLKVVGFGALVALGAFLVSRYRICQLNELCCLWCNHVCGGPKVVTGGGTFVFPIVQGYRYLSLDPCDRDRTSRSSVCEKVRVNVPSAFTIAVQNDGG